MLDLNNKTDASLFSQMEAIVSTPSGTDWCAVIRTEGGIKTLVEMRNRPCFGEMRSYGPKSTRPDDKKPGDLPKPLPIGAYREAMGVSFSQYQYTNTDLKPLFDYVFSKEHSPWKAGLPAQEHIHFVNHNSTGKVCGVILTDVEVDATTMVNLFRFVKGFSTHVQIFESNLRKLKDPFIALIQTLKEQNTEYGLSFEYHFAQVNSIKNMKNGVVRKLGSSVPTFAQGDDYNRPDLAFIFVPDDVDTNMRTSYHTASIPHDHISFKSLIGVTDVPKYLKEHGIV